jgi:hypothetical protein
MEIQKEYGIHFITVNGKYISIKEDYIEKLNSSEKQVGHLYPSKNESTYFTFRH